MIIITMLVAGVGLSRMPGRLLTGWVFALALRAEPFGKLYAADASPSA